MSRKIKTVYMVCFDCTAYSVVKFLQNTDGLFWLLVAGQ